MLRPIAYAVRSTYETLCPSCAVIRFPEAFPVETASDENLELLGEIYAHDLDDDTFQCDGCDDELAPDSDDKCPDCTPRSRCDDCERSYGPRR